MLTIVAYRFPSVDILALVRLALLLTALVVGLVALFTLINIAVAALWPLLVAAASKLLAGGVGTLAFAFVFRP